MKPAEEFKTIGRDFAQRRPPPASRHLPHTYRLGQAYGRVTGRWRTDDGWSEVVYISLAHLVWPGVPVLDLWMSHWIGLYALPSRKGTILPCVRESV